MRTGSLPVTSAGAASGVVGTVVVAAGVTNITRLETKRNETKREEKHTMKIFVIQNPNGKLSTGGTSPKFDEWGKVWRKPGFIKSHLTQLVPRWRKTNSNAALNLSPSVYKGCDLVEYELVEVKRTPVHEFYEEHAQAKASKEEETRRRSQEQEEAEERAEYERLKERFEKNNGR